METHSGGTMYAEAGRRLDRRRSRAGTSSVGAPDGACRPGERCASRLGRRRNLEEQEGQQNENMESWSAGVGTAGGGCLTPRIIELERGTDLTSSTSRECTSGDRLQRLAPGLDWDLTWGDFIHRFLSRSSCNADAEACGGARDNGL